MLLSYQDLWNCVDDISSGIKALEVEKHKEIDCRALTTIVLGIEGLLNYSISRNVLHQKKPGKY